MNPTEPAPPATPPQAAGPAPAKRGRLVAIWGALVIMGWVMTLIGRWVQGAPAALTGLITVLPWTWLVVALSAGLAALPTRNQPRSWLPCLAASLTFVLIWGRAWVPWRTPSDASITVMSWNLERFYHREGVRSVDDNKDCAVEAIRAEDPDALALLEVSASEIWELEGRLDMSCAHTDYGKTGIPKHGGLAVCSRNGWGLRGQWKRAFDEGVRWYYVIAEVVRGERVFNLLAVHLNPYGLSATSADSMSGLASAEEVASEQVAQARGLLERVSGFKDPTLVAGDFNSPRDSAVHAAMRRPMVDVWERGGWGPGATVRLFDILPVRVDYLYATRQHFTVQGAQIPDPDCSDHRPIVGRVALR